MTKFLLGLFVGAFAGVLIAPAPGEETRRRLKQRAQEITNEKVGDVVQMGRERAGEMAKEAAEKAFDSGAQKVVGEGPVRQSHS
jgi:gas vesicle protein